jgi:hypothetical protein
VSGNKKFKHTSNLAPCSLLSTRLGWSISSTYQIPVPGVLNERSNPSHSPLPDLLPLQAYERKDGPSMNMLPTEYPELQLFGRIDHDARRFTFASLLLSRGWEVGYHMIWLLNCCTDIHVAISKDIYLRTARCQPRFKHDHSPDI